LPYNIDINIDVLSPFDSYTIRTHSFAIPELSSRLILYNTAIKVNFAEARPGDVWPPPTKVMSGGGTGSGGQAGGSGIKAMSAKPENCAKLFIGNVSHQPANYGKQLDNPLPLYSLSCLFSPSKSFRMRLMMMRLQSSLALLTRR
jgi:hypothetical protein